METEETKIPFSMNTFMSFDKEHTASGVGTIHSPTHILHGRVLHAGYVHKKPFASNKQVWWYKLEGEMEPEFKTIKELIEHYKLPPITKEQ